MGLRRMKFRGALFVRGQALLTAAAIISGEQPSWCPEWDPLREAKTQALGGDQPRLPCVSKPIFRWLF